MTPKDEARFWSKVDQSGGPDACWPWLAGRNDDGYGRIQIEGSMMLAHRVACESKHGPLGKLQSLHSCDNPPCCNPDHTFPGTHDDNMKDCASKGRIKAARNPGKSNGMVKHPESVPRGDKNGSAKLTEQQIRDIRARAAEGAPRSELAEANGCHPMTISKIVSRRTWAHVV